MTMPPLPEWSPALEKGDRALDRFVYSHEPAGLKETEEFRSGLIAVLEACAAAERERCALIADEHAKRDFPWGSENSDTYHAQAHWAERIAKAIRGLRP